MTHAVLTEIERETSLGGQTFHRSGGGLFRRAGRFENRRRKT